jgi:hypothetical protein
MYASNRKVAYRTPLIELGSVLEECNRTESRLWGAPLSLIFIYLLICTLFTRFIMMDEIESKKDKVFILLSYFLSPILAPIYLVLIIIGLVLITIEFIKELIVDLWDTISARTDTEETRRYAVRVTIGKHQRKKPDWTKNGF